MNANNKNFCRGRSGASAALCLLAVVAIVRAGYVTRQRAGGFPVLSAANRASVIEMPGTMSFRSSETNYTIVRDKEDIR